MKHITARTGAAALSLCLLLALAACREGAPPAASVSSAASLRWDSFRFDTVAPGPEGCYLSQPRPESGANILYADYATGQLVYLCNRSECTHADESCTSFRSEGNFGGLCNYQDRLYILGTNALPGPIPGIAVCDKNGENAKRLFAFESGSSMPDRFVADGEAFYTLEHAYDEDRGGDLGVGRMVRIGLADGEKTNVSEKNYPSAAMLSGVGSEVVLYTFTRPEGSRTLFEQTILAIDKTTGEERVIYSVSTGQIVGAEGGLAYVLRMEDGAIDAVDLATGEVQTTTFDKGAITLYDFVPDVTGLSPEEAERTLANPPLMYFYAGLFDGKLFLDCCEEYVGRDSQRALYGIDLASGEVSRTTLRAGNVKPGNVIVIHGETESDFFVRRDYINAPFPSIGQDGVPYEAPYITNQYALISKEDFYASNPNYRDFILS